MGVKDIHPRFFSGMDLKLHATFKAKHPTNSSNGNLGTSKHKYLNLNRYIIKDWPKLGNH